MFRLRQPPEPPDPATLRAERVLLASEGREIHAGAIELAARIARERGGKVHVLSIARVWGSGFGLPNPGLLPNKGEWDEQRGIVGRAVKDLTRAGVGAEGHVVATRKATKRIVHEAERLGCAAIVMTADPARNRFVADLLWSQEPQRVQRLASVPVYLVAEPVMAEASDRR